MISDQDHLISDPRSKITQIYSGNTEKCMLFYIQRTTESM